MDVDTFKRKPACLSHSSKSHHTLSPKCQQILITVQSLLIVDHCTVSSDNQRKNPELLPVTLPRDKWCFSSLAFQEGNLIFLPRVMFLHHNSKGPKRRDARTIIFRKKEKKIEPIIWDQECKILYCKYLNINKVSSSYLK